MRKPIIVILISLLISILILCKKNSDSKEDTEAIILNFGLLSQRSNRLAISGTAVKGIIRNGNVTVNPLGTDGSCNTAAVLATGTTDDTGSYSLVYNKTGATVCLSVTTNPNGKTTLFDEKANSDVSVPATSNFKLLTVLPESKIVNNARKNAMISPFSKMLARRLQYLIKQAGAVADTDKLHRKASKEIVIRFGLNNGLSTASGKSFVAPRAADSSISDAAYPELDEILLELENPGSPLTAKFVSVLVGLSHLANKYKKGGQISIDDIDAMIDAFAADFEDGVFDGKTADGKSITVGYGANQITFSGSPLTTLLLPAIVSYFQEGGKLSVGKPIVTNAIITDVQISSQMQFVDNATIISADSSSVNIPIFSPPAGRFAVAQTVSISSGTTGADIRYTTDGTSPTCSTGTLYSSSISVSTSKTINAIACLGTKGSTVANGEFIITISHGIYIVSGANNIQKYDFDGTNPVNILATGQSGGVVGMFIDRYNRKIYWAYSSEAIIKRANLDGTNIESVVTGVTNIQGIAVDGRAGGKIYWCDFGATTIKSANLDGTGVTGIITDGGSSAVSNTRYFDIDFVNNKLYWTDMSDTNKLYNANLDGSSVTFISTTTGNSPADIAINPSGNRIYWASYWGGGAGPGYFKYSDLSGAGATTIFTNAATNSATYIEVDSINSKVYFIGNSGGGDRIWKADADGVTNQVNLNIIYGGYFAVFTE